MNDNAGTSNEGFWVEFVTERGTQAVLGPYDSEAQAQEAAGRHWQTEAREVFVLDEQDIQEPLTWSPTIHEGLHGSGDGGNSAYYVTPYAPDDDEDEDDDE